MSAFSFHETKNVISGEGGMLVVNDERFVTRAEIIWEKGTNRSEFFRGEVNKYGWKDIGSSFLPSELVSAFLYAQLERIEFIQEKRKAIWNRYQRNLAPLAEAQKASLPEFAAYAENNAHMFYLVLPSLEVRDRLIRALKEKGIYAVFHYLSLNKSEYYLRENVPVDLIQSDRYTDTLLRLPFFFELTLDEVDHISTIIKNELN
jgi:dTDP-4-amino-4,6-dideoxygalactose transaminase